VIDLATEQLISVADARARLPGTKPGAKIGMATLTRWIRSGLLESVKLGGRRFTSIEALQRFAVAEKQTAAAPAPPPTRKSEAVVRRVNSRLDRFSNAA
jgi:hypothetical protein